MIKPNKGILLRFQYQNQKNNTARILGIHNCHLRREMTAFIKNIANNKKQHTSLKLLSKVSNGVLEKIYNIYFQL